MNAVRKIAFMAGALTLAVAGTLAGTLSTFAAGNHVVGHVYIDNNTALANTVSVFDRHANGLITPSPSPSVAIGGAGTGAIVGSQGAIQLADGRRLLLAVDPGSNQISVLRVHSNGALTAVAGSPFASGGDSPVSIAVYGRLVYVGNSGGAIANYTGFTLSAGGALTPIAGSTFSLPAGTVVGDILFNKDGKHLVATRVDTTTLPSLIDSFSVGAHGLLTAAADSPFAAQSKGPFGSEFRPTKRDQLFVSNAHAGNNSGTISAYDVTADSVLHSIGASPYPDYQTAPCWVEISPNGRFLYAVNTAVSSISELRIAADGSLTLRSSTALNDPAGLRPFDARFSPDGRDLYVVDAGLDSVSVLHADATGALTELPGSPVAAAAGATPFGIAVS